MWQSRALAAAEGKLQRVMLVALAKEYGAVLPILLRVTFPGFVDIPRPFLCGYATIMRSGRVACDVTASDGTIYRAAIYRTKDEFVGEMRKLADKLKLNDADRTEMFAVLQKWIVADLRVGPNGERLAS